MDDLLQEFIAETRETLEALSGEVVAWEADPSDRARLDAIFRFVHTVKGSCGFLDLPRLARLSHAAEDVLAAVRDGRRVPDTALVNAVLAVVDRIGEIVEAIDAGVALDDSSDDLMIAALAENAAPASLAAIAPVAQRTATRSVRLSVDLLDRMMSGMSDMVLARNELARRLCEGDADPRVEASLERLSLTVAEMRDTVTRTRMQKIDALFSALPRMVRDTAASLGKSVTLTIDGADVELDREMIEVMRDPLVHIIRNAIDHGIEAPAARRAAGKREAGKLLVAARQSGNQIIVEVSDDGRGIDVDRLIEKRIAAGGDPAGLRSMSHAAKLDLIFEPGLSSRDEVSAVSGRGVGMDVVRANVEQIGGKIELVNTPGRGLCIVIRVPLTLSIISTVVVGVGEARYALPRQMIEEIVKTRGEAIRLDWLGDAPIATIRGRRLPLVSLADVLGQPTVDKEPAILAIVGTRDGAFALGIDAVLDTEELVVKPAAPAIMAAGIYAGQTLPDSGIPMLLLDGAGVAVAAGLRFAPEILQTDDAAVDEQPGVSALLFEDLDGQRRAVPLSALDRVEPVAADSIRNTGGRLRLLVDGRIIPLIAQGAIGDRRELPVLRLRDGGTEIAYAIAEPIDVLTLPREIVPAPLADLIAGVAMILGEQVEILDPYALFAMSDGVDGGAPHCLLQCDPGGWMETFLKPTLEGAGYRVSSELVPGQAPCVVLAMEDDRRAPRSPAPLVRLRRDRAAGSPGSIYRYDKPALIAALAAAAGGSK